MNGYVLISPKVSVANVLDRGDGGCYNWNWLDQPAEQAFLAEAKAAYPQYDYEQEDTLLSLMIDRIEHIAYLRRKTKTSLLYRLKDTPPGVWKTYKLKNTTLKTLREHVRKIHGDKLEMIANDNIEAAADFDMASTPDPFCEQILAQFAE